MRMALQLQTRSLFTPGEVSHDRTMFWTLLPAHMREVYMPVELLAIVRVATLDKLRHSFHQPGGRYVLCLPSKTCRLRCRGYPPGRVLLSVVWS